MKRQVGFSLVEIMVAMVAGLLLTAGIGQVYLGAKQTYNTQDQLSRLQENGRYALELLSRDLRMAGSLGCRARTGDTMNMLTDPTDFYSDFARYLAGFEASGTRPGETYAITNTYPSPTSASGAWSPALPAVSPAINGNVIPGTDILALRGQIGPRAQLRAITPTQLTVAYQALPGQDFVFKDSDGVGKLAMVADCQQTARIFEVTAVTDGPSGLVLSHGANWSGIQQTSSLEAPYPAGAAPAEVFEVATVLYYIGRRTPSATDPKPGPSLYRREGTGNAQEMVEGVENMQILYGWEVNPGSVQYVTAEMVSDWNQVVSVRIGLLLRSVDEVTTVRDGATYLVGDTIIDPVDDRRLRRVMTLTVDIRSQ